MTSDERQAPVQTYHAAARRLAVTGASGHAQGCAPATLMPIVDDRRRPPPCRAQLGIVAMLIETTPDCVGHPQCRVLCMKALAALCLSHPSPDGFGRTLTGGGAPGRHPLIPRCSAGNASVSPVARQGTSASSTTGWISRSPCASHRPLRVLTTSRSP